MRKRPLPVTIIGCVYILMGTVGFVYHLGDFQRQGGFSYELAWVELLRLLAIVSGVYLLRGHNWARWVALGWIAYHVILSAFHTSAELATHSVICALLAYFLLRRQAARYFGAAA